MIKYENVNRNKFHTELQNAGIKTEYVGAINDTQVGCEIIFTEGTDMNLVQQIIDKHDPTPLPPKPTEIEIQQEIISTLGQELALLKLQFMMGGM